MKEKVWINLTLQVHNNKAHSVLCFHKNIKLTILLASSWFLHKYFEFSVISSRSSRIRTSLFSWRDLIAFISSLKVLTSSWILWRSSAKRFRWWHVFDKLLALSCNSAISVLSSAIELDSHVVNFSWFGGAPWRNILISALQIQINEREERKKLNKKYWQKKVESSDWKEKWKFENHSSVNALCFRVHKKKSRRVSNCIFFLCYR